VRSISVDGNAAEHDPARRSQTIRTAGAMRLAAGSAGSGSSARSGIYLSPSLIWFAIDLLDKVKLLLVLLADARTGLVLVPAVGSAICCGKARRQVTARWRTKSP
jgi:hypothetical protein